MTDKIYDLGIFLAMLKRAESFQDQYYQEAIATGLTLCAAVERVRELHVPYTIGFCQACTKDWPCPTMRALDGSS